MPDGFEPTRRGFLIGLTALAAVRIAPAGPTHRTTEIAEYLQHFFPGGLATAIAMGRKYLRQVPSERSTAHLTALVFGESTPDGPVDIRDLATRVRNLRHRDYLSGDLVPIDGWLLARTEGRLFALAAVSTES